MAPWPFSSSSHSTTPPARNTPDPLNGRNFTGDKVAGASDNHGTRQSPSRPQPSSSPQAQAQAHTRRLSNTVFVVPKRKPVGSQEAPTKPIPAAAEQSVQGGSPTKTADVELGKCATCDSRVKWPKGIAEYRCGVCQMVNDARPPPIKASGEVGGCTYPSLELETAQLTNTSAPTIDIKRTKATLNQCIDRHLIAKLSGKRAASSKAQQPHDEAGNGLQRWATHPRDSIRVEDFDDNSMDSGPAPKEKSNGSLLNTPGEVSAGPPDERRVTPRGAPNSAQHIDRVENQRHEQNKTIFKPLEEYVLETFASHQCLNCSFLSLRPPARAGFHSEDDIHRQRALTQVKRTKTPDAGLSELDAKTLLLGDVAENGLWWTGKDQRTRSVGRHHQRAKSAEQGDYVTLKSPRINWNDVNDWYTTLVGAGNDWKERWTDEGRRMENMPELEIEIDQEFADARAHLQRVLLKASDSLLKRPGRPVKTPEDIRFLLIALANPLLLPIDRTPAQSRKTNGQHGRAPSAKYSNQNSHTFGLLKRILGLLSNLSNECHRYLTSWFARYREDDFRRLLELIQAFVTYRLGRQHSRQKSENHDPMADLIPSFSGTGAETSAQIHAALNLGGQSKAAIDGRGSSPSYSADWQVKAAARIMALLFASNKKFLGERTRAESIADISSPNPGSISRHNIKHHGQLVSTSEFYNTMVDYADLIADFDTWESAQGKFSFCQYPFFLSVGAKIRIMEHDARRQMDIKAREAFFNSILRNKNLEQYLWLRVRRDCLVEDSLRGISEVVGTGQEEIKKGLRIQFINEEGVDAGGLRKEWFLLLIREIFDPNHGMFLYDEDSGFCYFNPNSFEPSEQFFLVGAVLGLAIYNSTILDVALPPFVFKKLLMSGSSQVPSNPFNRISFQYTLEDLAEYRPVLASGLRKLLEYDGDVQETFCRDFVAEVERYGSKQLVPLCANGENRPVTNSNRQEFVDLYVRFLLDTQVSRQFEPFKRGFFTVCGGNALSLFQPEEIELLVRGSDEPLDVPSLKAVAVYENWRRGERDAQDPAEQVDLIRWFWEFLEAAPPQDQRRVLSFITGSDRVPAMGTASLVIKIAFAGRDASRFPIARTCFNLLLLYRYSSKEELVKKLWRAVCESEGFGLR